MSAVIAGTRHCKSAKLLDMGFCGVSWSFDEQQLYYKSPVIPSFFWHRYCTDDGYFSPEKKASVDYQGVDRYFLKNGDLVFARTGASVGKSYLYNPKDGILAFAGFLIRVKTDPSKLLPEYLANYVHTKRYWNWVQAMSMRSGQPGINGNEYGQLPIPLPKNIDEQRAIAAALSDVDALLIALDALIAKKRNIKQGAMQELPTGKKRLPGFSGEWEVKKLRELADIQRGASPRPIDSPVWYDITSKVGWIRIADVTDSDGIHLNKTRDYLSEQGIAKSRYLPSGSLIMSICATVGMPVITDIDACIHDGFVGFTKLQQVDQTFLLYKLKELEPSFKLMGQIGSQNNLNSDLVRNCSISLPPIDEQRAIAEILSDIDTEIAALEQRREKTRLLKQGMMQELLTGWVRLV